MACEYCEARVKDWRGDDPKCAFAMRNILGYFPFNPDNWNCAAVNQLWDLAEKRDGILYGLDCTAAMFTLSDDIDGDFLVLTRYKRRGKIDAMHVLNYAGPIRTARLEDVNDVLTRTKRDYD